MNFKSFVPRSFKINLICCLVLRAFKICSEKLSFERELEYLKSFFLSNNFPCKFVENSLIRTLWSIYNCKPPIHTVPKKDVYIWLPYLGNYSFILRKKWLEDFIPKFNLDVFLGTIFLSDHCLNLKMYYPLCLELLLCTNIRADSARRATSVKQWNSLKVRISQHTGRSFRTNSLLSCPENSKILDRSLNSRHPIIDNNFKILDSCKNNDLLILEFLWIHKLKGIRLDKMVKIIKFLFFARKVSSGMGALRPKFLGGWRH